MKMYMIMKATCEKVMNQSEKDMMMTMIMKTTCEKTLIKL